MPLVTLKIKKTFRIWFKWIASLTSLMSQEISIYFILNSPPLPIDEHDKSFLCRLLDWIVQPHQSQKDIYKNNKSKLFLVPCFPWNIQLALWFLLWMKNDVLPCASRTNAPTLCIFWIRPKEITHWTIMWNFLFSVDCSYLV